MKRTTTNSKEPSNGMQEGKGRKRPVASKSPRKTPTEETVHKPTKKPKTPASATVGGKASKDSEQQATKRRFGGPQEGSGRPRTVVDLGLVEKLAHIHASQEEIAAMLGVSTGFVSERMKNDPEFAAAHARGWSNGRLNLRRKQLEKAQMGDSTMLIWLGKNMLGQTDKAEVKTHQTFSFVVDLS